MNRLRFGAAALAFTSVAFGAFGAHALELSAEAKGWFDTATLYGLTHAVAALTLSAREPNDTARKAGAILLIGAMIFASTLYAMGLGAPRWFGAITPIGGTLMLIAWAWLAIAAFRKTDV